MKITALPLILAASVSFGLFSCSKSGGSAGPGTTSPTDTTKPTTPTTPTTPTVTQKDIPTIDNAIKKLMSDWNVPGLSLAITRGEKLVYVKAYGQVGVSDTGSVKPTSLFRLASCSKQFTSVGIMKLIEAGKLSMDARVFGSSGILGNDYTGSQLSGLTDITISELLHHTTGNWPNDGTDPMFQQTGYSQTQLIDWVLNTYPDRGQRGQYYYSNFGYCVLGRVIEKLSGKSYAQYIQDSVLTPCGIKDMVIGGNTLADRKANEVLYYGQSGDGDPYGMNVTRMDSHGGWLATATDLARFLVHVDGFPAKTDILKAATETTMITASTANPNYACGWAVNSLNNWWHNGSLPGTTTEQARLANGFNWVILTNTRTITHDLDNAIDAVLYPFIDDSSTPWQDIDQF